MYRSVENRRFHDMRRAEKKHLEFFTPHLLHIHAENQRRTEGRKSKKYFSNEILINFVKNLIVVICHHSKIATWFLIKI